jgi:ferredoxin
VAAHAIGYEDFPIWITYYGNKLGLGSNNLAEITIRGADWTAFEKSRLKYPLISAPAQLSAYDRITAVVNNTVLRPRPIISTTKCTGCGDCESRCPVHCIDRYAAHAYRIDLNNCADCGCCLKVCEVGAVNLEFVGLAKIIRTVTKRLPATIDPRARNSLDPSPRS